MVSCYSGINTNWWEDNAWLIVAFSPKANKCEIIVTLNTDRILTKSIMWSIMLKTFRLKSHLSTRKLHRLEHKGIISIQGLLKQVEQSLFQFMLFALNYRSTDMVFFYGVLPTQVPDQIVNDFLYIFFLPLIKHWLSKKTKH